MCCFIAKCFSLNNALYVRFMPQKVHIRALLLLGYLQPLQTVLRCNSKLKYDSSKKFAHRKLQSSFSHDDTMIYRADAPICSPSGQYPILWDPQYVILKPFTCSISLLCLVGQNNYFSEKCILVSSLLVVLVCVFNWIASSIEFYSSSCDRDHHRQKKHNQHIGARTAIHEVRVSKNRPQSLHPNAEH